MIDSNYKIFIMGTLTLIHFMHNVEKVFWSERCKIFNVCLVIFNIIHDTLLPTRNTAELFKYF